MMNLFPRVKGQARAKRLLSALLKSGNIPPAILFHGPDGVGKTLLAYELAQALLCPEAAPGGPACGSCSECAMAQKRIHPDLKPVDALYQANLREEDVAKQRTLRVDTIRHLRHDMEMQPFRDRWKIAVIEEAHALEIEAANALLKILEEPPPRTLWILASSQKERMPKTVVSRCFSVAFAPLSPTELREILAEKGFPNEESARLSGISDGSLGRAVELSKRPGWPESLVRSPLAPFEAAEKLPRELPLARRETELGLFALAQILRTRAHATPGLSPRALPVLRDIARLRLSLQSNADPRAILTLAALKVQEALR